MLRRIHHFNLTCQIEAQRYNQRLAQYLKTCEEHNRHCYPCWALYNNNQMVSAKYFNLINCMQ